MMSTRTGWMLSRGLDYYSNNHSTSMYVHPMTYIANVKRSYPFTVFALCCLFDSLHTMGHNTKKQLFPFPGGKRNAATANESVETTNTALRRQGNRTNTFLQMKNNVVSGRRTKQWVNRIMKRKFPRISSYFL